MSKHIKELWKELSKVLESKSEALYKLVSDFIVDVNTENINYIIKNNKLVFLFFTADWCGPCVSYLQTFREVASLHILPNVFYGKVNVDSSYTIADKYKVRHIPSIMILINGDAIDSIVGQTDKSKLESKIVSYINAVKSQL